MSQRFRRMRQRGIFARPFVAPVEGGPALNALTLSAATFGEDDDEGDLIGVIVGKTAGSVVQVIPADGRVAILGNNLVVGATAASVGEFSISLRETLAGASNSPRTSPITITVEETPALELPAIAGSSGFTMANNARILAALAALKAGAADVRVTCLGDSTTWGEGGGTSSAVTNAVPFSYPAQLASQLRADGLPAAADAFYGSANTTQANQAAADPRVVFVGAGWTGNVYGLQTNVRSVGGVMVMNVADQTSTIAFTPGLDCDTADIWFARATTFGTAAWSVDGGAETTINTTGTPEAIFKSTVSLGAPGPHTIKLRRNNANQCFLVGIEAYNSTAKRLRFLAMGARSFQTTDWVNVTRNWQPGLTYYGFGQKLAIINNLINDWNANANPATSMANLQTMITKLQTAGSDVWLVCPQPCNGAGGAATQAAYKTALQSLAASNGCTFIDMTHDYPTWAAWNGASLAFDALHPNGAGYAYMAGRYRALINALYAAA
jgi:lysophospholipase L1-like esterase